jgi:hypothetical protein
MTNDVIKIPTWDHHALEQLIMNLYRDKNDTLIYS